MEFKELFDNLVKIRTMRTEEKISKKKREVKAKEESVVVGNNVGPNGEVVTLELVTPEIAAEWLKLNTKNRKMKTYSKDKYARDLKSGRWMVNGSSICFLENGNLADGQNRLKACVDSGASFYTVVVRGIKEEALDTIDMGNSRTVADVLSFNGFQGAQLLSSTAKRVLTTTTGKSDKRIAYSTNEILEEITREDRSEFYKNISKFTNSIYSDYKAYSKTYLAAAYIITRTLGHTEEEVLEFFEQLADKKAACNLIRGLRRRIMKVEDCKVVSRADKFKFLIYCWNEFTKGNQDSEFPSKRIADGIMFI